jgi:hypothetical protein
MIFGCEFQVHDTTWEASFAKEKSRHLVSRMNASLDSDSSPESYIFILGYEIELFNDEFEYKKPFFSQSILISDHCSSSIIENLSRLRQSICFSLFQTQLVQAWLLANLLLTMKIQGFVASVFLLLLSGTDVFAAPADANSLEGTCSTEDQQYSYSY